MDDTIVSCNDKKEESVLKQCLSEEFEIKELGTLKIFLRDRSSLFKS